MRHLDVSVAMIHINVKLSSFSVSKRWAFQDNPPPLLCHFRIILVLDLIRFYFTEIYITKLDSARKIGQECREKII